jgi:hypothetical protein
MHSDFNFPNSCVYYPTQSTLHLHLKKKTTSTVADKDTVYLRPLVNDFLSFCVSWGPHLHYNGRHRVILEYFNYATATLGTDGAWLVGTGDEARLMF